MASNLTVPDAVRDWVTPLLWSYRSKANGDQVYFKVLIVP